jgi:lipoprotein-anchoring transpeptidase ErfK/SrfK
MGRRPALLVLVLVLAVLLGGCAFNRDGDRAEPAGAGAAGAADVPVGTTTPATTTSTTRTAGPVSLGGNPDTPVAAWAKRDAELFSRPSRSARIGRFPARTPWGGPSVFLVRQATRDTKGDVWLQVLVPRRPNGGMAWVQARWFLVAPMRYHITVDLSDRRLQLFDGVKQIRTFPVAVGSSATPTPVGRFFITVKLQPPVISSVYGDWALGLSGYSDVLDQFGTGDGQIALHGTTATWAIGKAVSNGCVRMTNRNVGLLAKLTPPGTPVTIQA